MEFKDKNVHFIGIGGVSMSALAKLVELEGAIVTGSDAGNLPNIPTHSANNVTNAIDIVVINGAIAEDNPEFIKAKELGIQIIGREFLLAEIEHGYKNRIAIAGSHGKSTTTAMVGAVLAEAGFNPTVHNGAMPNLLLGGREYFVTEACEFKKSFLSLSPTVAVVTNIDADHMDCYRDLEDIRATFTQFTNKAKFVVTPSLCRHRATRIREYAPACYSFCIKSAFKRYEIRLQAVGRHNVDNAILAVNVGRHFGISFATIKKALEKFKGINRRFESIGKINNCEIIVDYAHHPAEIKTTIQTAKSLYGKGNYLIVFQPHTYTRTLAFFNDFVNVLGDIDCVLYKTFAAREKPIKGGKASDLARALGVKDFLSKTSLQKYLATQATNYKAIILTGAGDINRILESNT